MYEQFFNLSLKPFDLLPNPDFIYLSKSHKRAITYIDYGIRERAGFILLTGEVGSGKTTIIRNLIKKRDEKVVLAKVFNTRVDSEQLLAMINDDFGLPVKGKDKVSLIRELNLFLIEQYAAGKQPVLIIDEAQNLSATLLEEIRMLSNLETDNAKLLQIILVGQPELRKTLADSDMRQLRQRISINCNIQPLTRSEIDSYIHHRLEVAGNRAAVEFEPEALEVIYVFSRGIPRLINIICDFLMISAFAEGLHTINGLMARDVVGELDFEEQFWGDGQENPAGDNGIPFEERKNALTIDDANVFMFEMNHRIDTIEKRSTEPIIEVVESLMKKLDGFEKSRKDFEETVRSELASFRNELRSTADRAGKTETMVNEAAVPKKGFLRTLFT